MSLLAEELVASQEQLCSMEFVIVDLLVDWLVGWSVLWLVFLVGWVFGCLVRSFVR
jgi:hypothetical protein